MIAQVRCFSSDEEIIDDLVPILWSLAQDDAPMASAIVSSDALKILLGVLEQAKLPTDFAEAGHTLLRLLHLYAKSTPPPIPALEALPLSLARLHIHVHIFRSCFRSEIAEEAVHEHDAVIKAIRARDGAAAEAAMRRHIERSYGRLRDFIE